MFAALLYYTIVTIGISQNGVNLFPDFFGDMAAMEWPGQFNFDFMLMLMLSALWTAWRNNFSVSGLLLAVIAFFGGASFLSMYLLYLTFSEKRNVKAMLVGRTRL
ncbi:hypothetical protein [Sphingorhabdus lutea]|nr:hypothetical protein [Sphingorhabdus lutea]